MKFRSILTSLLLLVGAGGLAAAQNPFVGAWKLNQQKSHLAGGTIKFDPAQGQAIELTAGGDEYSFRLDGNPYRTADGDVAVWKQVDPSTWTTAYRKDDGGELSTDTWKLSSGGNTLTVVSAGVRPNGESFSNSTVYVRTAGTDGLMGSWKSTEVTLSAPNEMIITGNGLDGISIAIPALKASLRASFDGKDVAPTGPTIPPGLTISLMRIGPASFRLVRKVDGTVASSARYTLSSDGKTLTETGNAIGDPPQTSVWEKQ